MFKLKRMVPDRIIPGTLNAGHTLPTVAQAFAFTAAIPVGRDITLDNPQGFVDSVQAFLVERPGRQ